MVNRTALERELDLLSKKLAEINEKLYATKLKKATRLRAKLKAFEASHPGSSTFLGESGDASGSRAERPQRARRKYKQKRHAKKLALPPAR